MRAGHGASRLGLHMELGRQLQLGEVRSVFPVEFILRWSWIACVFSSLFVDGAVFGREQSFCLF